MANPIANRRPSTTSSQVSRDTRGSHETCASASTAPSSVHGGQSPPMAKEPTASWSRPHPQTPQQQQQQQQPSPSHLAAPQPQIRFQSSTTAASEDVSPGTSIFPRDSVDTYDSRVDSEAGGDEDDEDLADDDDEVAPEETAYANRRKQRLTPQGWAPKLPSLGEYLRQPEHDVIPSNPQTFARLFPSMDRLLIRHDDLTADGNMNLRVDTVVPASSSRRRQSAVVQLFHLRMHDLDRREFSLRRYCRDSGREVCKSKRRFTDEHSPSVSPQAALGIVPATAGAESRRPSITRSVSSALKVLKRSSPPATRRASAVSMLFGGHAKEGGAAANTSAMANAWEADDDNLSSESLSDGTRLSPRAAAAANAPPAPTNSIKLEFSNYARVDVARMGGRSGKRYDFAWWGHTYSWKRVVDHNVEGVVSFHLVRDGQGAPVAHIVPESRTPTQVRDEEDAGGWIPPCYMWISDDSLVQAVTDVAE
jgi:hypothetical protein